MSDNKPESKLDKVAARWPLYTRIGWAAVVVFGLVGNCAGHREGSAIVFIVTAIIWANVRIIQEAVEAFAILRLANEHEKKQGAKEDDPPPPPPPAP